MKKRIYAIAALVLFLMGIALFIYSLIIRSSAYTLFIILLILPAVLLVVMNRLEEKRQKEAEALQKEETEDA